MKKILIVIDMQNDFVSGTLGAKEAEAIVPNVVDKINEYKARGDVIITTQDTHFSNYLQTLEGKKLPVPHCIINSDGWQLENSIYNTLKGYENYRNFTKYTFGSVNTFEYLKQFITIDDQRDYEIEIVGLVLNICVISNALLAKAYFPEAQIAVDLSCTAATSSEDFKGACQVLQSCQVDMYG